MAEIVEVIHRINYEVNNTALLKQMEHLTALMGQLDKIQVSGNKTRTSLSQIGSGITQALGLGGGLAGIAATATTAVKDLAIECVKTGIAADRIGQAFDTLNKPGLLDALRKATQGTVSDIELMRTTLYASKLNVPVENLADLFAYARIRAFETGETITEVTRQLVEGIGTKSTESLRQLGVDTGELGKEFTKTGDFAKAAFKVIADEAQASGTAIDGLATKTDQITTRFENFKANFGKFLGDAGVFLYDAFTTVGPFADMMNGLDDALEEYANGDRKRKEAAQKLLIQLTVKYKKEGEKAMLADLAKLQPLWRQQLQPLIPKFLEILRQKDEKQVASNSEVKRTPGLKKKKVQDRKKEKEEVPELMDLAKKTFEFSLSPSTVTEITREPDEMREPEERPRIPSRMEKFLFGKTANIQDPEERRREEIRKSVEAYKELVTTAVAAVNTIYEAEVRALDREIAIREQRVDAAMKLAERGNTEALKIEQERLEKAQKQREEYARRQQVINAALAVSDAVLAVAHAAAQTGAGALVVVPAVIAAIIAGYAAISAVTRESSGQAFADGVVNYRGNGGPRDDANWVRISSGESIITAQGTLANRNILEAINNGAEFRMLDTKLFSAVPVTYQGAGFASKDNLATLEKKLDGVIEAVKDNQFKQDVFFNEHGVGLMTQKAIRRDRNRFR